MKKEQVMAVSGHKSQHLLEGAVLRLQMLV